MNLQVVWTKPIELHGDSPINDHFFIEWSFLYPSKMNYEVEHKGAKESHDGGLELGMLVMALGDKVGRSYI